MEKLYKMIKKDYNNTYGPLSAENSTTENIVMDIKLDSILEKENSFAIVGIRCNTEESVGKRKLTSGVIYNFIEGYIISKNSIKITKKQILQNTLYDECYFEKVDRMPHVKISAIVGQNGSGKSSIIEFMMRLINNFAASTLGEKFLGPAAERLHYIDGMDGDLWFVIEYHAYHLKVKNCNVKLYEFKSEKQEEDGILFTDESLIYNNLKNEDETEQKELLEALGEERLKELYNSFFYTLISNQSIYAYNTNDFRNECNSDVKEALALDNDSLYFSTEEKCWLHGLFHKNDAYSTPLVITPFRREGCIDINNERDLSLERLVRLYIKHENYRIINEHLIADSLEYIYNPELKYNYEKICSKLEYKSLTLKGYEFLKYIIVEQWGKHIGFNIFDFSNKPYFNEAIEYLVYKTLKISFQYKEHRKFYDETCFMSDSCEKELISNFVNELSVDNSHITRKLFQVLGYIICNVYDLPELVDENGNKISSKNGIKFSELTNKWLKGSNYRHLKDLPKLFFEVRSQAIIPPPFMSIKITLCEKDDDNIKIDFDTLSSGEKQQIFSISSIMYHLDNLDSAHKDKSYNNRICYKNICVVLEEIELYYHPELQQQFVQYFLNSLKEIALENIKCIHLIIVTHSPYVLSDIPKTNVLALKKDSSIPEGNLLTFGANIHEMLKDSFFLKNSSLGYFAQWEIGHLMAIMKVHQWAQKETNTDFCPFINGEDSFSFLERYIYSYTSKGLGRFSYKYFNLDLSPDIIKNRILLIDEPILFNILMKEYNNTFPTLVKELRELKRKDLMNQLKKLDDLSC